MHNKELIKFKIKFTNQTTEYHQNDGYTHNALQLSRV